MKVSNFAFSTCAAACTLIFVVTVLKMDDNAQQYMQGISPDLALGSRDATGPFSAGTIHWAHTHGKPVPLRGSAEPLNASLASMSWTEILQGEKVAVMYIGVGNASIREALHSARSLREAEEAQPGGVSVLCVEPFRPTSPALLPDCASHASTSTCQHASARAHAPGGGEGQASLHPRRACVMMNVFHHG